MKITTPSTLDANTAISVQPRCPVDGIKRLDIVTQVAAALASTPAYNVNNRTELALDAIAIADALIATVIATPYSC